MKKLLQDPLIHFLFLGAAIFVLFAVLDDDEDDDATRIVISADQVRQAVDLATMLRGDTPDREQIEQLLEPVIREQVLYREARALGLDRDDETVRLRLVEKMRFLTEDLIEPELPDDARLRAFYDADPQRFAIPARVNFEQVYFSPRERGDALRDDVAAARSRLEAGEDLAGDSSPLRRQYPDAVREQVEVLFGEPFAAAMFSAVPGSWYGPFESDFGVHLAFLHERVARHQPSFDEAREAVLDAYLSDHRHRANEAEFRRMRDRYEVVIDWSAVQS